MSTIENIMWTLFGIFFICTTLFGVGFLIKIFIVEIKNKIFDKKLKLQNKENDK